MVRLSAVRDAQTHKSYRSYPRPDPACDSAAAREPPYHLLPLKSPMDQPSFQQPKNEADDRVDEELIEVYKKSRG